MARIENVTEDQLIASCSLLSRPADEFGNDPSVEAMWAIKAMDHALVYFNILCSVDPKFLKLTLHDDQICELFNDAFPNMKIDKIDEDKFKSKENKIKWRAFCEQFKNIVEDYSFGTLLRIDCTEDYSEKNTMLTTRIQFYAIELARNRQGLNDGIQMKYKPTRINVH